MNTYLMYIIDALFLCSSEYITAQRYVFSFLPPS